MGGYSLLERRVLLTRAADLPYSRGGYSLPERREADTPYSRGGYSLLERWTFLTSSRAPSSYPPRGPSWLPAPRTLLARGRWELRESTWAASSVR